MRTEFTPEFIGRSVSWVSESVLRCVVAGENLSGWGAVCR